MGSLGKGVLMHPLINLSLFLDNRAFCMFLLQQV